MKFPWVDAADLWAAFPGEKRPGDRAAVERLLEDGLTPLMFAEVIFRPELQGYTLREITRALASEPGGWAEDDPVATAIHLASHWGRERTVASDSYLDVALGLDVPDASALAILETYRSNLEAELEHYLGESARAIDGARAAVRGNGRGRRVAKTASEWLDRR